MRMHRRFKNGLRDTLWNIVWIPLHRLPREDAATDGIKYTNISTSNLLVKPLDVKKLQAYCMCDFGEWMCQSFFLDHIVNANN